MIPKFTCEASVTNNGVVQVHLVSDNGQDRADVFINAAESLFDGSPPREGARYVVHLIRLVK